MKNLGPALAVGITAVASAAVAITGLKMGQPLDISLVMASPAVVAVIILFGDGWEN